MELSHSQLFSEIKVFQYLYTIILLLLTQTTFCQEKESEIAIQDEYHYSTIFSGNRSYRIFLPGDYDANSSKHYPVIYFFHGWAQRYFGSMGAGYSNYDKGEENEGDNMEKFVSENDVIIVKVDGLNNYTTDPLNLSPYNVSTVTTFRQFPTYFKELVDYIDSRYRTIADREHRAVSGLSMGGFMTFWLAAKFPDMISAAGNFCGSTEFTAGPVEFPVQYSHADVYDNFKAVNIRLNNGTRDRLRFYHQDMNRYLENLIPHYEFEVYEASHITCGMGDMFDYILKSFENPLPLPDRWDYIDIFPFFQVWDYTVETTRNRSGYTILEDVDKSGFKLAIRNFLPDGELMPNVKVKVITAPLYEENTIYYVTDVDVRTGLNRSYELKSDTEGRLNIESTGSYHHIGISKSTKNTNVCVSNVVIQGSTWAETGQNIDLNIKLLNKGLSKSSNITAVLTGVSDGLEIVSGKAMLQSLASLEQVILSESFTVKNTQLGIELAKFRLTLRDDSGAEWVEEFELPFKDPVAEITDFIIADGQHLTVVKAAVDSVSGLIGVGNGDGKANPGETIEILVKQDGKFIRTNAYALHSGLNPNGVNIRKVDKWSEWDHIGGSFKYNKPVLDSKSTNGKEVWFYIEYWLPGTISGQHLIKKGKVKVPIQGKDLTAPEVEWTQILNNDRVEARVYDGGGVSKVIMTFMPNTEKSTVKHVGWDNVPPRFELELVDDGSHGDIQAGDGIYSRQIENRDSYYYDVVLHTVDGLGNEKIEKRPGVFFLKNTY